MQKYLSICLLSTLLLMMSCTNSSTSSRLHEGRWHGEFMVGEDKIPFQFDVTQDSLTDIVTLINGSERVKLTNIVSVGDTITIPIEAYDTELRGILSGDRFEGKLRRLFDVEDKVVDFVANYTNSPRFVTDGLSGISIDGKWDIDFISSANDTSHNVGIFNNQEGIVTGSILTNSGDLRFLEGVIDKEGFRLSAFAGLSPYLVKGIFSDDNHFEGEFITARGIQKIVGKRNDQARLENPYSQAQLREGLQSLSFNLKDIEGISYALSDSAFKEKVVVISILGSWCPNCLDEMQFLVPWYNENKDRGVELIGISFERKDDPEYINKVLSNLITRYNTTYPILIGGKIGDEATIFPEITKLRGYPTTIFVDKKGNVKKIHTGFNGPATGLFYEEFQKDFNKQIDELLNE